MLSRTSVRPMSGNDETPSSSRQIATYLKEKQSSFLNSVLDRKASLYNNLKYQLKTCEKRFHETSSEKTRLANLLFQQERQWRKAVEVADKKKVEATAAYIREHSEFSTHMKDIRDNAHSLSNSTDEEVVLMALEEKRLRLKSAQESVLEATKEVSILKEKEEEISLLTKKFQDLKELQFEASHKFHKVKSDLTSASRDLARVHSLVNSVSTNDEIPIDVEKKPVSRIMKFAGQLWSHIGVYTMTFKQRN